MSDATDIFGQPVPDVEKARESFHAGGSGTHPVADLGGAGLCIDDRHGSNLEKQGCTFERGPCELSEGHPPPHCVRSPYSTSYYMVDEDGFILRVL